MKNFVLKRIKVKWNQLFPVLFFSNSHHAEEKKGKEEGKEEQEEEEVISAIVFATKYPPAEGRRIFFDLTPLIPLSVQLRLPAQRGGKIFQTLLLQSSPLSP